MFFFLSLGVQTVSFPYVHEVLRKSAKLTLWLPSPPIVSVLSILKNPMILLAMVSMGLFFVMPKLVDNSKLPLFSPLPMAPESCPGRPER